MATWRQLTNDGPLSLTEVTWDRHMFQLPNRLPTSVTPSQRNQYYCLTVNGINVAACAPPHPPRSIFLCLVLNTLMCYAKPTARCKACIVTTSKAPANTFIFSSPSLFDGQGNRLVFPAPNASLNNVHRRNSRFYNFHVSINARAAYTGLVVLANRAQLSIIKFVIAITLPCQLYHPVPVLHSAPPPIPHTHFGCEALTPAITVNKLENPELLLTAITIRHVQPPVVGFMSCPNK